MFASVHKGTCEGQRSTLDVLPQNAVHLVFFLRQVLPGLVLNYSSRLTGH